MTAQLPRAYYAFVTHKMQLFACPRSSTCCAIAQRSGCPVRSDASHLLPTSSTGVIDRVETGTACMSAGYQLDLARRR
eukprot:CAMPEP_0174367636 /NCGR_PEP_ID=MMETSP0811_2-20130205/86097_1 /TAXON_ID=73025 ORGANISM="Eutreptiella gymnastica-like, Strain CCMP1594" /NCGR_SAMPLE_ID=MMETSP0811_2 /ASSEMBLY_ACC=CAM_ASM_000667 /LENGTH=77 /DNA_ID=CAMNT_0015510419 /DNA_START=140 /DNA_END=373 /DNA_ORIENTATION=-